MLRYAPVHGLTMAYREEGAGGSAGADGILGVDELHIVYTEFRSLLSQVPVAKRMAPLEVEEVEEFRDERDEQLEAERTSDVRQARAAEEICCSEDMARTFVRRRRRPREGEKARR